MDGGERSAKGVHGAQYAGVHRCATHKTVSPRENPQTLHWLHSVSASTQSTAPHLMGDVVQEQVQVRMKISFGFQNKKKEKRKKKVAGEVKTCGVRQQLHAIAAGTCAAQKPCLIASNLNFTSLQKSHRDSLQVMTSGAASCVVTPYILDTLSPACWAHPYRQRMPTNSSAQRSQVCVLETHAGLIARLRRRRLLI